MNKLFSVVGSHLFMIFLVAVLVLINQYLVFSLEATVGGKKSSGSGIELTGDLTQDAISLAISQGVPEIYGPELDVSFDEVQAAINVMKTFDPTYGRNKITLTGDLLKRYTDIGLRISCEYCCSAKSIVFQDGRAACGCAHSQAMRGLAAYLLQNHSNDYSNDEILKELARWKGMYFPKQMISKMMTQLQSGQYSPDIAALLVGVDISKINVSGQAPLPSDIQNLPSMVGGC